MPVGAEQAAIDRTPGHLGFPGTGAGDQVQPDAAVRAQRPERRMRASRRQVGIDVALGLAGDAQGHCAVLAGRQRMGEEIVEDARRPVAHERLRRKIGMGELGRGPAIAPARRDGRRTAAARQTGEAKGLEERLAPADHDRRVDEDDMADMGRQPRRRHHRQVATHRMPDQADRAMMLGQAPQLGDHLAGHVRPAQPGAHARRGVEGRRGDHLGMAAQRLEELPVAPRGKAVGMQEKDGGAAHLMPPARHRRP